MKTVYVQHLLKVLLEEYEDIDYMLEALAAEKPTRRDSQKIRHLLSQLSQENDKLLSRFGD
ncbi:MAG: hypothetical protein U1D32_01495 [Patescibacteria group bacterium]|nr:hypothetical protein [Patescibacteria group bacterium]